MEPTVPSSRSAASSPPEPSAPGARSASPRARLHGGGCKPIQGVVIHMTRLLPAVLFLLACGSGGVAMPTAQDPNMSATSKPAKPRFSRSGHDLTPLSKERIAEINKTLTPEQIRVTQHAGTEP